MKVTPGIRPHWYQKADDQKRVMTPAEAIKLGANLLVIGRPITEADDPVEAVERTNEEIKKAM
jgi:orotidine-5'-phosphate decarboxylase